MKKLISFLFVLVLLASCSKSNLNEPVGKAIIGHWKLTQVIHLITKNDTSRYDGRNVEDKNIVFEFNSNGYLSIHNEPQADSSELYPYEVTRGRYFLQDTTTPPAKLDILTFGGKRYTISIEYSSGAINKKNQQLKLSNYTNMYNQVTLWLSRE